MNVISVAVPFRAGDLRAAAVSGAAWVWLYAADAQPDPSSLQPLMLATDTAGATPVTIVAGAATGPDGAIDPRSLPGFAIHDPDVYELACQGLLPIRHAPFVNCLVAAGAIARHGAPEPDAGPFTAAAWTGQVLRDTRGYFTAASRLPLRSALPWPSGLRSLPPLVRMVRGGTFSRGDALAYLAGRGAEELR